MKAFVTGGTGLLGNNLVRQLVQAGHEVTVLARSTEKARALFGNLPVTVVQGDMQDVAAFAPALAGHNVLFHTAAYFREYFQPGDHWHTLEEINVKGTVRVLEAAEQYGIDKVIYTSSSTVIGMQPGCDWGDETCPPDAHAQENLYARSKVLAEEAVHAFLKRSSLPVVLILPGWMFGPGDAAPTSSGQLVLDFLNRKLPATIAGGGAPVDVRDVAGAMLAAMDRGRSGERYIVGGDSFVSFAQLNALLEQVSGIPGPRIRLPYPLTLAVAWLSETSSRLTGKPALVTVNAVRTLRDRRLTRSTKAVQELGVNLRPLVETLRDEVAWFRAQRPELLSPPNQKSIPRFS